MRISPLWTVTVAVVAVVVLGFVAALLIQPPKALLSDTSISAPVISPNADGVEDAARLSYTLNRSANLTIIFTNTATHQQYVFRQNEPRSAGPYQVLFSGLVKGYPLPGEPTNTQVETRLVPDGDYTWTITATGENGERAEATGDLKVQNADSALPAIQDFSVSPAVFTPNQDGIDDRVTINTYLAKPATLSVSLQDANGQRYYVPERIEMRKPGDAGAHVFDYDGGVDNDVTPPPDGDYRVVAVAEDAEGQRVTRTSQVSIKDGGLPQVEIQPQSTGSQVRYVTQKATDTPIEPPAGVSSTLATIQVPQDDLLVFRLTVNNYGPTPIRAMGPWPGTSYQWDQVYTGMLDPNLSKSGAWYVGLQCELSETSFPWRWAIGSPEALTKVVNDKGETFYYLMPGQRATTWGAVHMSKIVKARNPQECWAALIHEDVAIPPQQDHVGSIKVEIVPG